MLMGTLKETLIYRHDEDACFYRYEIYKSELRGGYFAMVYVFNKTVLNNDAIPVWQILFPSIPLKSNYLPNAKIECTQHFNIQYKISVEG